MSTLPMIELPPRVKRATETALIARIRKVLCAQPDCILVRNTVGYAKLERVRYGLGTGSPDLVGCVTVQAYQVQYDAAEQIHLWRLRTVARVFALEVKRPGHESDHSAHVDEQRSWLAALISRGGYGAIVSSVDGALAALHRARQL